MLGNALRVIVAFLDEQKIDYMLIGGLANGIYGVPRQTLDIDIKICIDTESLPAFVDRLTTVAAVLPDRPLEFMDSTSVLPVVVDDTRVNLVIARLLYELQALARSVRRNVLGIETRLCTAEDLIIQKCISEREKDWMDIEGVVQTVGRSLDWNMILDDAKQLSEFLNDGTIISRLRRLANG